MFDIFFVQQLVNGLSIGLIYALMAIGFTLIFGVLNVVNFAHGEVYMIGAFAGLMAITHFAPPLFAVILVALAFGALAGFGLERIAFPSVSSLSRRGVVEVKGHSRSDLALVTGSIDRRARTGGKDLRFEHAVDSTRLTFSSNRSRSVRSASPTGSS